MRRLLFVLCEIVVRQAKNSKLRPYAGKVYIGKVLCPKCGEKGTLSLKSGGSFQVKHYVKKENGKDKCRYCTLASLGGLYFHPHRALQIGIPVWVKSHS